MGELVSPSQKVPGGLLFEDVMVGKDYVRVRISRSKTDVFGRGEWLVLHRVDGEVCPVVAVEGFLTVRRLGTVFLSHEDGSSVTRFQFSRLFRRCLLLVGEHPKEYGTHSFRIGAATEASRAGMSDAEIQRIGRWR